MQATEVAGLKTARLPFSQWRTNPFVNGFPDGSE